MQHFADGVWLGLGLSILVGPILIALVQISLEHGFRRGIGVGAGIWCSDLLMILLTYFGVSYVKSITDMPGFEFWLGLIGGLVLMLFGIGMIMNKKAIPIPAKGHSEELLDAQLPPALDWHDTTPVPSYSSLFLKGFIINTLNPFTVFFWTGVATTMIAGKDLDTQAATWFYAGVLFTIIVTDSLKSLLAKLIRPWLEPRYILSMRSISGVIIFIFGVVLIVRVLFF